MIFVYTAITLLLDKLTLVLQMLSFLLDTDWLTFPSFQDIKLTSETIQLSTLLRYEACLDYQLLSFGYVKNVSMDFQLLTEIISFLQAYGDEKKKRRVETQQCNVIVS